MALGSGGSGGNAGGIRAGAAFVELYVKNGLLGGLNQAAKDLKHFGSVVTGMGQSFIKIGAIGGAALGGIFGAAASNAATFDRVAAKLGDTTENLSAFAYAAESVGMKFDDLIDNFENWPERLVLAASGAGEAAATFKLLGIDAAKMAEMPITEQMIALAASMEQVGNESQRLQILGSLFSDKGQWFNELFKKGPGGIRGLMADAGRLGSVVTTEQGKQGREVTGAMAKSWTAIKNAVLQIGAALLPQSSTLAAIGESVTGIANRSRDWIEANLEVVIGVGLALAGVTAIGVGLIALGPAISALGVGFSVLTGAISVAGFAIGAIGAILASPFASATAAAAAFGVYMVGTSEKVRSSVSSIFGRLKDSWSGIVGAIGRGDLDLAMQIATATLKAEWSRAMTFIDDSWKAFKDAFTLDNIKQVFKDALAFIRDQFLATFDAIRDGDYSGAFGFGGKQTGTLEDIANRGKNGFSAGSGGGDWGPNAKQEKLDADVQYLLAVNKFRSVFASMKGDPALVGAGGGGLAGQIAGNAMKSLGAFGGSANVGMFGQGGDIGKKIADNTKETADGVKKLTGIMSSRHDEKMGQLTVEGGT